MSRIFSAAVVFCLCLCSRAGGEEPSPARPPGVQAVTHSLSEFPALPPLTVASGDWPFWRGPQRNNHAPRNAQTPSLTAENVRWQIEVPGRGHASPILCGELVALATADQERQLHLLLAYKRGSGELVWQTEVHRGGFQKDSHRNNSHASATPAFDGTRFFTAFIHELALWVSALDVEGNILWQTKAGDFDAYYGFGMSPTLWGPLVIVAGDNDRPGAFLAALHRQTGEVVWRVKRPNIDTYGTPLVAHVAGRDQLLIGGGGSMCSYDPATGKLLWKCAGPTAETTANTVAFSNDTVFVTGGYPKPYIAMGIRADGAGDVDATHALWTNKRAMSYVPSPLYADGLLYVLNDDGIISCLEANDGKPVWSERLGGDYSASPLLLGGTIVLCSEQGLVTTLAAGGTYQQVAQLDLTDSLFASPTVGPEGVYVRTVRKLIYFAPAKERLSSAIEP